MSQKKTENEVKSEVPSREAELVRSTELMAAGNIPDSKKTPEEIGAKENLQVKPLQYNVTDPEQREQKKKEEELRQPAENQIKEDRIERDFQEHGLIKPDIQRHGLQELDTDGNPQRMTEKEIEVKSQEQEGVLPPLHKDSTVLRTDKIALAVREERARKEEQEKKQQQEIKQKPEQKEKEEGQQKK